MNYNFQSGESNLIQKAAIQAGMSLAKTGAFTIGNLVQKANTYYRKSEFVFDEIEEKNSAFIGDNKLVSLRFLPVIYYPLLEASTGVGVGDRLTEELDLHICEINVSRAYDVIQTKLLNEVGTIKEVWAGGSDYNIDITGVLVGDFGVIDSTNMLKHRPMQLTIDLLEICNSNVPIPIISPYLNEVFFINSIQILSVDLPFEPEWKNLQRFSIRAVSDNQNLKLFI
jgi:hypothetical protein